MRPVRPSPSVVRLPPDNVSYSLGDDAVELAASAGLMLDDWQAWVLRTSLARQPDGLWASFLNAVVVPRQNGKGSILEARELAGLFLLNEQLILHSAHEFKTTYEHFLRIVALIEGCPDLEREVLRVRRGAGGQAIELRNGNRLRFIARSSGSGRGMSAPLIVLDESMFLQDEMLGAILPAASAQSNPQLWLTGSAPLQSSAPIHRLRQSVLDGKAERVFWAEWGNDIDVDPFDEDAIRRANPAYGVRIWPDFVTAEREAMAPSEFARERLGVVEKPLEATSAPIEMFQWNRLLDGASLPEDSTVRLAVDVPPDRRSAFFAIAGVRPDNLLHVSVRFVLKDTEMVDLVKTAKQLCEFHKVPLILPPLSPVQAWKTELKAAGVELDELSGREYSEACGLIQTKVTEGSIRHRGHPEMMTAVAGLAIRKVGDVEQWSRRSSTENISAFVAATCALLRVSEPTPFQVEDWFVDLDEFLESDE